MDPKTAPAVTGIRWWVWVLCGAGVYLVFAPPEVFGFFLLLVVWLWVPLVALFVVVRVARAAWK